MLRKLTLPAATAFLISLAASGGRPALADDIAAVKERLFEAKKGYDAELQKFRRAVGESLDRREEAARQLGNKRAVDQLKAARDWFQTTGELPPECPRALVAQVRAARARLDRAYQAAVRDCVRLKADEQADALDKERQRFLLTSAFVAGKLTRLSDLKPSDVRAWNNWFENDSGKYKVGAAAAPHSVFMHPNFKGDASASYAVPPKVIALRATVGVPKHEEAQRDPASPLTFEVLGDGKSLWKSEPVAKLDAFQTCEVRIEKVKVLTLRVHCPQEHGGAHAVWFSPILAE
jgi:hypothetical protein